MVDNRRSIGAYHVHYYHFTKDLLTLEEFTSRYLVSDLMQGYHLFINI